MLLSSMLHVKMTERVPVDVLFGETEWLERNVDRTEKLVFLDSVVTPNGYLAANNKSFLLIY